jgi:hypothetical protein
MTNIEDVPSVSVWDMEFSILAIFTAFLPFQCLLASGLIMTLEPENVIPLLWATFLWYTLFFACAVSSGNSVSKEMREMQRKIKQLESIKESN